MLHPRDGLFFCLKGGNSDVRYMTTSCSVKSVRQEDRYCVGVIQVDSLPRDTENSPIHGDKKRKVVPGGLERWGTRSCCSMGTGFQFCKTKRVLEIEVTTIWMFLALPNCTRRNDQDGKFYVIYILPQLKT